MNWDPSAQSGPGCDLPGLVVKTTKSLTTSPDLQMAEVECREGCRLCPPAIPMQSVTLDIYVCSLSYIGEGGCKVPAEHRRSQSTACAFKSFCALTHPVCC